MHEHPLPLPSWVSILLTFSALPNPVTIPPVSLCALRSPVRTCSCSKPQSRRQTPRLAFLYHASRSFLATHMHLVMIAQMSLSVRGRCFLRPIAWDAARYPTLTPCAVHTTHRFSPTDIPVASSDLAGPSVILRIPSPCVDIPPRFYCARLQVHLTYLGGLLTHIYHRRRPLSRGTFIYRPPSITAPRTLEYENALSSKSQA